MRSMERRLVRLEEQQAVQGRPWGRDILLDLIDVPPEEAERRIAEAEAQKGPGAMLIIVEGTRTHPEEEE